MEIPQRAGSNRYSSGGGIVSSAGESVIASVRVAGRGDCASNGASHSFVSVVYVTRALLHLIQRHLSLLYHNTHAITIIRDTYGTRVRLIPRHKSEGRRDRRNVYYIDVGGLLLRPSREGCSTTSFYGCHWLMGVNLYFHDLFQGRLHV